MSYDPSITARLIAELPDQPFAEAVGEQLAACEVARKAAEDRAATWLAQAFGEIKALQSERDIARKCAMDMQAERDSLRTALEKTAPFIKSQAVRESAFGMFDNHGDKNHEARGLHEMVQQALSAPATASSAPGMSYVSAVPTPAAAPIQGGGTSPLGEPGDGWPLT